jgi:hypothetical protein
LSPHPRTALPAAGRFHNIHHPEHSEWLALLRVRAGAISKLGEVYV